MKVKMKCSTVYKGTAYNVGRIFDLEDNFAKELIECKRALLIEDVKPVPKEDKPKKPKKPKKEKEA